MENKKKEKLKKILDYLGTIITAALMAIAVYCLVGINNQKNTEKLFFPFGHRPVMVLSGSMEDELKTGAVVIVKETKEVEENDIIFFITENGTPVIHRYIDTDGYGNIITKGDANSKEDLEPVTPEQVQGKVVLVMNWVASFNKKILFELQ